MGPELRRRFGGAEAPADAELVAASRAGEEWAMEALFRRHARMAGGLAFRLMGRDGDVDDVVQDAYLEAFRGLARLDDPQAFASWLAGIVVRIAHKRLRRRRLLTRLGFAQAAPVDVEAVASPQAPPDVVAELRAVYALLDTLPPEGRVALVLRRVEGLSLPEIAKRMGRSLATVKRRLDAAERALAATLEGAP